MKGIECIHFPQLVTITGCMVYPLFLDQRLRGPARETGEGSCLTPLRESLLEVILGQDAGHWVQWNPRTLGG